MVAVKSSLTANTYRGSLIAVSPLPAFFQPIELHRATRHSSVNLVLDLFKEAGLLKPSIQLVSVSVEV